MIYIILPIIMVVISFFSPLWLRLVLLGVNAIIPDTITYLDEILQGISILKKILMVPKTIEFIKKLLRIFKFLIITLGIVTVIGFIIYLIFGINVLEIVGDLEFFQ